MNNFYKDKSVLITGGAGSIGSEIVRQLYDTSYIRVFDNNENAVQKLWRQYPQIRPIVGDVKNLTRLENAMDNIQIVFHCAALKHVTHSDYYAEEMIAVNVIGTQNVIQAAYNSKTVHLVVLISTDKAVYPINVMGATKLLAERMIVATKEYLHRPIFCAVRFGNIWESSGSLLGIVRDCIERGEAVPITDRKMTRYFIKPEDAVALTLQAGSMAKGGEIFVPKSFYMPRYRIRQAVKEYIKIIAPRYGKEAKEIKTKIIGNRGGEKIHEKLITNDEKKRKKDAGTMWVV